MISPQNGDEAQLLSRAYQLEMFQASMERNIIITMDTGSGKTHVACLRIEAELQRSPTKRIWFLAPTVVLCQQQSHYLSSLLQGYNFRTLLGSDNVDRWSSQKTWDAVLSEIDVVVSTPQVLLDALNNAFVSLAGISLLVLDEAHHCNSDSPAAMIMRRHYHCLKAANSPELPHVLGLTASPILSKSPAEMERLEKLLDASCRSPTRSVVEYRRYVHLPQLLAIDCATSEPTTSALLTLLQNIDLEVKHTDDPYYRELLTKTDLKSVDRLQKYTKKRTPAMEQVHKFASNAKYLSDTLGTTACDDYIRGCVKIWHESVGQHEDLLQLDARSDASFIDKVLLPLRCAMMDEIKPSVPEMTTKVAKLIKLLTAESAEGIKIVIFVTRRTTALTLSALLNTIPWKGSGRAFAFLGAASLRERCLFEVTDIQAQHTAFADFRNGIRDICVATASLEEGIDVQEINTVVRFDPPPTFKSYIQSRGRARKPGSKFVFFLDAEDAVKRYAEWNDLEKQIKAQHTDEMRALKEREIIEAEHESDEEVYRVESTNATLDYTSAIQRLNHFCATQEPPGYAVMTMEGEPGQHVTATAVLPSSLPAALQKVRNKHLRRTERMAKRDAAFQACVMLHEAGLLNDNLLPPYTEKVRMPDRKIFEDKQTNALQEIDVWHSKSLSPTSTLYMHCLDFNCAHLTLPGLQLILPTLLDHDLEFQLQTNHFGKVTLRLRPGGEYSSVSHATGAQISKHLIQKVFGAWTLTSENLLLLPNLPSESLNALTSHLGLHTSIDQWLASGKQSPLLFFSNRHEGARPYQWIFAQGGHSDDIYPSTSTVALRQSPHLQFYLSDISDQASALAKPRPSSDCHADSVATTYGCSVQLVPSVLHIVAAALRAREARRSILQRIPFQERSSLTQALITKSCSSLFNYERLEFLGDAILKYLSCLQAFFDTPQHGSDALTAKVSEIVGNDYLLRSTRQLGLDAFISATQPSRTRWQFPYSAELGSNGLDTSNQRKLSSKTLADVIESIIGAAFLQGHTNDSKDQNSLCALGVLLPEVSWNCSKQRIQDARGTAYQSFKTSSNTKPQQHTAEMLGYDFADAGLIQQALTHSTELVGLTSYDRLEFLGDAILDRIIKVKLYDTTSYDPARMTLIRHAVVSHALLAFIALGLFVEINHEELELEPSCKVFNQSQKTTTYLIQLISTSRTVRDQILAARSKYEAQRTSIMESLDNGKFPWTLLYSLNAPKVCSDVVESLLAATYLDSGGSLEACEKVLDRLDIMQMLQILAQDDTFELRPSRVMLQESMQELVRIDVRYEGTDGDEPSYQACLNITGFEPLTIVGATCKEEAECRVAEKALSMIDTGTTLS